MIYVNGDSHTAPYDNSTIWVDYLSDITKKSVVNHAMPGSNNDRIFRSSLDYLNNNPCELVILGTSFITREEFWDDTTDFTHTIHPDEQKLGSKFITSQFKEDKYDLFRSRKLFDFHKPIVDYYFNLYLFSVFCKSKNIKYFIFSAAQNYFNGEFWDPSFLTYLKNLTFYKEVIQDKNIWDTQSFCLWNWKQARKLPGDTGHLIDDESHKMFAEFLYNELLKDII